MFIILYISQALLLTFSFAFFNGLIASWFCVMDITFQDLPIADTEDMVNTQVWNYFDNYCP